MTCQHLLCVELDILRGAKWSVVGEYWLYGLTLSVDVVFLATNNALFTFLLAKFFAFF